MVAGHVTIASASTSIFLTKRGSMELTFQPSGSVLGAALFDDEDQPEAFHCSRCGLLLIQPIRPPR
jgi:hypothetical protein